MSEPAEWEIFRNNLLNMQVPMCILNEFYTPIDESLNKFNLAINLLDGSICEIEEVINNEAIIIYTDYFNNKYKFLKETKHLLKLKKIIYD